jgi:hypothetical protein
VGEETKFWFLELDIAFNGAVTALFSGFTLSSMKPRGCELSTPAQAFNEVGCFACDITDRGMLSLDMVFCGDTTMNLMLCIMQSALLIFGQHRTHDLLLY